MMNYDNSFGVPGALDQMMAERERQIAESEAITARLQHTHEQERLELRSLVRELSNWVGKENPPDAILNRAIQISNGNLYPEWED